jgi:ATP/ADP translocase/HEAT repeat protein
MASRGLKQIERLLGRFVDIRRDEVGRVFPLAGAYGLVLASLYVLKPVRNSLFLNSVGIDRLPYVLLLVALAGAAVALVLARFAAALRIDVLIKRTFTMLMAMLVVFWLLIDSGASWVFYIFYVWVSLYSLLTTSMIWLLANAAFNAREARRLFGFVGSGGIAGAILGGIFTGWAVDVIGTRNLALVCVALLFATLQLLGRIELTESPQRRKKDSGDSALKSIAKSPLLGRIAGLTAIAAAVAVIVDIQFNDIVDRAFPGTDAKTAFFGEFFAYLSAFAFLFQLLVAPKILRSLGIVAALMFLPVGLAIGSAAVFLAPILASGVLIKVADGGFRHSINKSAMEILFLPVPAAIKEKSKLLLDTTVDTAATGLGALLVLVLTGVFGLSYQHMSFLSIALILAWFVVAYRSRSAYVDAFRQAIERREIDLSEVRYNITEAGAIRALTAVLSSDNVRQLSYALDVLAPVRSNELVEQVLPLLKHESAEVRLKALRVLRVNRNADLLASVEELLADEDLLVLSEAIAFVLAFRAERREALKSYLEHRDERVRVAALGCLAEGEKPEDLELVDDGLIREVLKMEGSIAPYARANLAVALGRVEDSKLQRHLVELRDDPSPMVVGKAIEGLGQSRAPEFVPWLIGALGAKRYRKQARDALARYGPEVLPVLQTALADPAQPTVVRAKIPRVMSKIPVQHCADLLLGVFERAESYLKAPILKALAVLGADHPEIRFSRQEIERLIIQEAEAYYRLAQGMDAIAPSEGAPGELMTKVIGEKRQDLLERIFGLLQLAYDPQDIKNAYEGIRRDNPRIRASALEFLDNLLKKEVKTYIFPIIDDAELDEAIRRGQELFDVSVRSRQEALLRLIETDDPWLRAVAIYNVTPEDFELVRELILDSQKDASQVVREAAELALSRIEDQHSGTAQC